MKFNDNKPIYLQIADYFYESILSGKMKANQRILSVRELAVQIEVNPNTVMRTYSYLQEKGIIYNKRGIGYFVSEKAYEILLSQRKQNFISKELPYFFKTIELLGMSLEEISAIYKEYKNNLKKENHEKK